MFIVYCPWMFNWSSSKVHCTSHLQLINPSILVHAQSLITCGMLVLSVVKVWLVPIVEYMVSNETSYVCIYCCLWHIICMIYVLSIWGLQPFSRFFSGGVLNMTGWTSFDWFSSVFCWLLVDSTAVCISPFAFNAALASGKSLWVLHPWSISIGLGWSGPRGVVQYTIMAMWGSSLVSLAFCSICFVIITYTSTLLWWWWGDVVICWILSFCISAAKYSDV